jgi:hypothetical protein
MNKVVPTHSRLVRELVLVEDPALPFAQTDKGTVRAKVTLEMYKDKIEAAYNKLEQTIGSTDLVFPSILGKEDVSQFLSDVVKSLIPDHVVNDPDADLFEHGLPSCCSPKPPTETHV